MDLIQTWSPLIATALCVLSLFLLAQKPWRFRPFSKDEFVSFFKAKKKTGYSFKVISFELRPMQPNMVGYYVCLSYERQVSVSTTSLAFRQMTYNFSVPEIVWVLLYPGDFAYGTSILEEAFKHKAPVKATLESTGKIYFTTESRFLDTVS